MVNDLNIILITIDCLRVDYIGCMGNLENITPNIDNFAKQGVVFTQTFVNGPSTPFSFPSIFTSSYPLIDPNFPKLSRFRLTIASVLRENGFVTAGINSNPYLSRFYDYDVGFSFFDDIFSEKKPAQKGLKQLIKKYKKIYGFFKAFYQKIRIKYKIKPPYQRTETITKKAINWIKNNKGNKFIWLHIMDTHHPFLPPKRFRITSTYRMYKAEKILKKNRPKLSEKSLNNIKSQYKATIRYVDEEFGNFIEHLKKLKIFNNSLIIITADHGEEFKEHGGFSHQCKLYDELIHVPLIIMGPKLPKNLKIEKLVSLIDLAPTILEYLSLNECNDFMGKSFLSLFMRSDKKYKRQGVISESLSKDGKVSLLLKEAFRIISYRTDEWKLIINEETNTKELYNLKSDPKEIINIYNQNVKIADIFEKKLIDFIEKEKEMQNNLKKREELKKIIKSVSSSDLTFSKIKKS